MKTKIKLGLLGIISLAWSPIGLHAGGVVATPDEASLRAALAGGGLVTFACDGTITLANTLVVTNDTTLNAAGRHITISGNNTVRVFTVTSPVNFTLLNLTVADGLALGTNGSPAFDGGAGQGGGVWMSGGSLALAYCTFRANRAEGGLGGTYFDPWPPYGGDNRAGNGGPGQGGAVWMFSGTLQLSDCSFATNSAAGGAGPDATYAGSAAGSGGKAEGGAIYLSQGSVQAVNCQFNSDTALGGKSGSGDPPPTAVGGDALGGALWCSNSTSLLAYSRFVGNSIKGGLAGSQTVGGSSSGSAFGGALCSLGGFDSITNCLFAGNSGLAQLPAAGLGGSGGAVGGGAIFTTNGVLEVGGTVFATNSVTGSPARRYSGTSGPGQGGAICSASQMRSFACVFQRNSATGGANAIGGDGEGGAVYSQGTALVRDSWFWGNTAYGALGYQGGVSSSRNGAGKGGAICSSSPLELVNCTFSDNQAVGMTGGPAGMGSYHLPTPGLGGAVYAANSCAVTNCTLAGNLALGGPDPYTPDTGAPAFGGAIFSTNSTLISVNSTFALNAAQGGAALTNGTGYGGAICSTNGTATLLNTIVANSLSGSNCFGTMTDLGHNLSSDASCSFTGPGSLNNTDPVLAPLDYYGGPTMTMALLAGSPAMNGADPVSYPPTDQRGRLRPFGAAPDIGAFESSPPYSIRGTVSGFTLTGEVSVTDGLNTVTTVNGRYTLAGLGANPYTVTPQSASYLFVPANRSVTVGPDQVGVDFKAYRWNMLSLDDVNGGVMHVVFAGTNGVSYRLQSSSNLPQWTTLSNYTIGLSGYWELYLPVGSSGNEFYRTATP